MRTCKFTAFWLLIGMPLLTSATAQINEFDPHPADPEVLSLIVMVANESPQIDMVNFGDSVYSNSPTVGTVPVLFAGNAWATAWNRNGQATLDKATGEPLSITINVERSLEDCALTLYHEILHCWLGLNYPGFAVLEVCESCVHQFVYALTASAMCAKANDCNGGHTEAQRNHYKRLADVQDAQCTRHTDDCSQSACVLPPVGTPVMPSCPGDCDLIDC